MKSATQSPPQDMAKIEPARNEFGLFSSESVLNILKLILDGSELSEVLTIIAGLVESLGNGMFLHRLAFPMLAERQSLLRKSRPSLPGFPAHVGPTSISPNGAIVRYGSLSEGARLCCRYPPRVYLGRLSRPDVGRTGFVPFGRDHCSRGKVRFLGTFAILYREVRTPRHPRPAVDRECQPHSRVYRD